MSKYYVIKCGKLYDGINDYFQNDMEILVEDNKIKEVDKHVSVPNGAETIDLSKTTVTPGLIDAHMHLGTGDWRQRRHETIFENPVYKGMAVLHNAKKAMLRGFTSLRHMGSNCDDGYGSVVAKRMINAGYFEGSRLVVAPHYVGTTRGHGDSSQQIATNPMVSNFIWSNYPGYGCGADSLRDVVRRQVKFGADFIKMFGNGGFSTPDDGPEDVSMSDDEMRAIIETAHNFRKKVTCHTYTASLAKKLIEMGIDGIEHGSLIDDPEVIKLMETKGIDYVPTFCPYEDIIHLDETLMKTVPYEAQLKLRAYGEQLSRARQMMVDSNLELGYGTDMVWAHNCFESGYEYKAMFKSGMDPLRILKAATRVNAKILEMPNQIGAIASGYFADIAAWKKDLLTDEDALLDCHFVMKDGVIYKTESCI